MSVRFLVVARCRNGGHLTVCRLLVVVVTVVIDAVIVDVVSVVKHDVSLDVSESVGFVI